MSFFSPLLHRVNSVSEVPIEDAYILYDMNGGILWVKSNDYPSFILQWIGSKNPPAFTMDLASTGMHSVVLDFDTKRQDFPSKILLSIYNLLKMTLQPTLPHFTYIVAFKRDGKGIHIHLPECKMAHDDYILLCEDLQYKFSHSQNEGYQLDIPTSFMLSGAAKPNHSSYEPNKIVYVGETKIFTINLNKQDRENNEKAKKELSKLKKTKNSFFLNFLNCMPDLILQQLHQYMMPVVAIKNAIYTLKYSTAIGTRDSMDWKDVASFNFKRTNESFIVRKRLTELVLDNVDILKVYHYLKINAVRIDKFETNNNALKTWFERFQENCESVITLGIPEVFQGIHDILRFEHARLAKDPNPIKTVMQFKQGYYFLPVFYSLCRYLEMDSKTLVKKLRSVLDEEFQFLLTNMERINPKNIEYAISEVSINTLHFCADNLSEKQPSCYREKLKMIIENNNRSILSVTNKNQMTDLVRNIQERHIPIRVLQLKNALKKPARYVWNSLSDSWQEVVSEREVSDHLTNLWISIKEFLSEYRMSGGKGGPDEDILNTFKISEIQSAVMSNTTMERKKVQMDAHKWFLRVQGGGTLDLLTGHIGGVVPEFFLSDRKIDIGIPRDDMLELCKTRGKYAKLYETLTDKTFYYKYLKNLFIDVGDNLFDTLYSMIDIKDDLSKSMLYFYVNLCKCMSFEYDNVMYLLDVLASIFVGTNYERKFFVWKGVTRNGKSKLLELMSRILGGYYHSIQSENLSPGHGSSNATPELASTLFSCRMVASEELEKKLDENRIKQITGNSFVAFRNLYEQNSGGIPTAKLFATTNNYPECKATEAFKDRTVAIPFDAEFADNVPQRTSEQLKTNIFAKEVYVVEQSFQGGFFLLYYHLKRQMSPNDALLHYRPQPENVTECTRDYLVHADIYAQFKICMDVQLKEEAMTTMNDVKSAIRQYLKISKNTFHRESELVGSFEAEFGSLRRMDISMGTDSCYTSFLDDEGEKKKKLSGGSNNNYGGSNNNYEESTVVFYDGVVIKNLRRTE